MRGGERNSRVLEEELEAMDMSGLGLEKVPSSPSINLAVISKLDLSNNNLESIPESLIARLLNLAIMDVHSNQLRLLPNSIGCLSKLKVLNVSANLLETLPKTIENCKALEDLNATFNNITTLPDTIGFELLNLRKLSLSSNKLPHLPYSTSHLTSLRVLDIRLNCLRSLPQDLENLVNLEVLNVSQNFQYLETLPYSIGLLLSLRDLDVSYNKIKVLPESIAGLTKLQKLCVLGNPLVSPPIVVTEQSIEAVKEYLLNKMNGNGKEAKKSWIGKLVKCGTFNGSMLNATGKEGFLPSKDYRSIDGLSSPGYLGMFSPKRLFSPRHHFAR
ncbi:hypothetical protein AMTR_s00019p00251160 [Amborella trichopoda]|uniref:Uncharacterized protein n=2 Tax=Amborella trichopoda TaxID=13333 RepID=W1PHJ1_AMBTC|nr:hypothetical protein AMTR_s00019p00251160 [Amborella trichopoda]